ncbi:Protein maelstrom [Orchesella cincta]|uniref:Protein maelstrom n=1 Tax=Orchesella cincta TaxID=48709 RepID=A0A1D2N7K7_ORCCI|nr:Protein maelstrom [Orchesella cincta]
MPKQKKSPNSYYFFLKKNWEEFVRDDKNRKRFDFQEAASRFGHKWKQLSKDEKQPFEAMAKEEKEREKLNHNKKFTTFGESFAQVNGRALEQQEKQQQMKNFLKRLTSLPDAGDRPYIFMKAVYSVEEIRENNSRMYWPLEMSMAVFSLKEGIKYIYTVPIDTRVVPMGYSSAAMENAGRTLLPLPGDSSFPGESSDYKDILRHIFGFANHWLLYKAGYDVPGHYRVFFCHDKEKEPIMTGLQWMVDELKEASSVEKYQYLVDNLKLYNVNDLILAMNANAKEVNPSYISYLDTNLDKAAESVINKGNYDYREEIACPYHKSQMACMKMETCAQSIVLKRVFMLFDELLPAYGFTRTHRHEITNFKGARTGPIIKKKQEESPAKVDDTIEEPDWLKEEPQGRSSSPDGAYGGAWSIPSEQTEPSSSKPSRKRTNASRTSDEDDDAMPSWTRSPTREQFDTDDFPSLSGDSQRSSGSARGEVSWASRGRGSSARLPPPPANYANIRGARGRGSSIRTVGPSSGVGRGSTSSSMFEDEEDFPSLGASNSSFGRKTK